MKKIQLVIILAIGIFIGGCGTQQTSNTQIKENTNQRFEAIYEQRHLTIYKDIETNRKYLIISDNTGIGICELNENKAN